MRLFCYINILFLLVFIKVNAQQGSPFTLSANYFPVNSGNEPIMLNSNFSLNIPVHRGTLFTCLTGTNFKYFRLNLQEDTLNINNLYSWSIPVTSILRISPNKIITLLVEPIISSDFKNIGANNFRYNMALFYGKKNGLNSWGIGLAISKRFSGFQIIPLGTFNFHLDKNWVFSGIFPFKPRLIYELDKTQQIGISFGINNNSFRLSDLQENHYINSQLVEAGFFYQKTIVKHFKMDIFMGIQSLQTEIYNRDQTFSVSIFPINQNKNENAIESFTNNGLLLQFSFSYALF